MEEEMYWEERRRYEEEMDYYEWQRRQGRPGPVPPRPFPPMPPSGPGVGASFQEIDNNKYYDYITEVQNSFKYIQKYT